MHQKPFVRRAPSGPAGTTGREGERGVQAGGHRRGKKIGRKEGGNMKGREVVVVVVERRPYIQIDVA